ncbi:MAG: PDZ domain-containing protein [Planctomycetota bacterium]
MTLRRTLANAAVVLAVAPLPLLAQDEVRATAPVPRRAVAIDVFEIEPFDPVAWERRLTAADLDLREDAYERLAARLPSWPEAQAWVREQSRIPRGELAWTCRLLRRDLDRRARAGGDVAAVDPIAAVAEDGAPSSDGGASSGLRAVRDEGTRVRTLVLEVDPLLLGRSAARPGEEGALGSPYQVLEPPDVLKLDLVLEDLGAPVRPDPGPRARRLVFLESGDASGQLSRLLPSEVRPGRWTFAPGDGGASLGASNDFVMIRRERDVRSEDVGFDLLGVLVASGNDGIVVLDVVKGSVAAVLGIGAGDHLVAIDDHELASSEEIPRFLERARRTGRITLRWQRSEDGALVERRFVRAAPDGVVPETSAEAAPAEESAEPTPPGADAQDAPADGGE